MKKKVIALIMIIPLIFLITIFSVGKVASIFADIPVSGIKITTQSDEGFIYLDMAKYSPDDPDKAIYMTAQVEPSNAKNQKYTFSISSAEEGAEPADIAIDNETGLLTLNGPGKAKVTAISADKGYTDSVVVNVRSSKVVSLEPTVTRLNTGREVELDNIGKNEYSVTLAPEDYQFGAVINPIEVSDSSVKWSSSDSNIITINSVTGRATTKLSGEATITLDCDNVVDGFEPVTIKVTVPYNGGESGLSIEGHSDKELMFSKGKDEVSFLIELESAIEGLGVTNFLGISGSDSYLIMNERYEALDNSGKRYRVTLTLANGHPENVEIELQAPGKAQKSTLVLSFSDFKFNVYNSYHTTIDNDIYQKKDAVIQYVAVGEPNDDDVIYEWTSTDSGLSIQGTDSNTSVFITGATAGDYIVIVSAYEKLESNGSQTKGKLLDSVAKTIHIVRGVYSVEFVNVMGSSDMEGVLTLGDVVLDDSGYKYQYHPTLNLKVAYDDGSVEGYSLEDLSFEGSDNSIIAPFATNDAFKVSVNGSGVSTITAKWKNGVYFNQDIKTTIKLRGAKGAVMIGAETTDGAQNYRALKKACADGKAVILMKDVMLGWKNMTVDELKAESYTMLTDYDWTYYANMHEHHPSTNPVARPSIYYLIEFHNDVYGNGYTINADYMAMAKNSTGNPLLFKGPLNFVAIETASVKAQDNIVFLVRDDGVDINNINLKGCSDESLLADDGQSGLDLTKLNYAGTTLEISANTRVTNSRISNGRTVVRIFGGEVIDEGTAQATTKVEKASDVNLEEHRVNAHIESCILSNAREFLLKIGSNLSVFSEDEFEDINYTPAPFTNASGVAYNQYSNANAKDEYFYNNYVITDVTLKNSILSTSGLFAIGVETHFAGNMLGKLEARWNGCGGTSFASVLKMEGDVKLYDWKQLDKVDSTTLIETTNSANDYLVLRIDKMLEKVVDVRNYHDIVSNVNGEKYVHGGIAMYGGGRNYSCILTDNMKTEKLTEYFVNIRDLAEKPNPDGSDAIFVEQGNNLPAAAGDSDFVFYMYDSQSSSNKYEQQQAEINSGNAFKLPIAPVEDDAK